jgi:hypothetical protein
MHIDDTTAKGTKITQVLLVVVVLLFAKWPHSVYAERSDGGPSTAGPPFGVEPGSAKSS